MIDLHVDVPAISAADLSLPPPAANPDRTLADLAATEHVGHPHIAEALSYRRIVLGR